MTGSDTKQFEFEARVRYHRDGVYLTHHLRPSRFFAEGGSWWVEAYIVELKRVDRVRLSSIISWQETHRANLLPTWGDAWVNEPISRERTV